MSVRLDAADVLHEFWVPELARKMSTVPGHPNHIWVEADKPGTYLGVCSEFCGTQHAWMRFLVIAGSSGDLRSAEKAQLAPAAAPTGEAAQGLALFKEMSCMNCHADQWDGCECAGRSRSDAFREPHAIRRRHRGKHAGEFAPVVSGSPGM